MSNFNSPSLFNSTSSGISIPQTTDVVFVSDLFSSDHLGGAELTTDALIDSSPLKVYRLHSKDLTVDLLRDNQAKYWIFGNFSGIDSNLVPTIIANMKYSVVEYDYKFCKYRSPEKHESAENTPCDCKEQLNGKIVSAFYHGARSMWWMSEKQMELYHDYFPFLREGKNTILSSVFDDEFFVAIKDLREKYPKENKKGWAIVGSTSWIKGVEESENYCKENNLDYEVFWKLPYSELLEKFAQSEGMVFLPKGKDTCPRIVIEAKLLGCELVLNDNVQHSKEIWFDTDDMMDTESYLYMSRERFWNGIKADMSYVPALSGYTTTRNCVEQDYPFEQSIKSMLGFCNEVVVVDGGSTDETWSILQKWAETEPRLKIHQEVRDWDHTRFAVFDGEQKALARSLCSGDLCWQQDSDEIVHENDYQKILNICLNYPRAVQLLSLPVIEYWGGPTKVRMDILPWKWRLSKNLDHITHGIPGAFRKTDENGDLYAAPGTDGCDYIHIETLEVIPNSSFCTPDVEQARRAGLTDKNVKVEYEKWFNSMTNSLPSVHHYSWFDIKRKINTYKNYWSRHWQSLYNIEQLDTPENNMFFGRSWSDVTDDDIDKMSNRLSLETGGWIFHSPINFSTPNPSLKPSQTHPDVMNGWVSSHRPLIDENASNKINVLMNELLEVKGSDNWKSVRKAENNYVLIEREYSFGTRKCYELPLSHKTYENLQQSRGLNLTSGDNIDSFLNRSIDAMEDLTDSDHLRIREILKLTGIVPTNFAELGFRVPRLQRYFLARGSDTAIGYDVSDLSLRFGESIGYDVRRFDFSTLEGNLNLKNCDLVVSYHMLEHISDPLPAVKKIYDEMDNNAVFHAEIPIEPGSPRLEYAHMFPFHKGDLGSMLVEAGFEITDLSTVRHYNGPEVERYTAVKRALND